MTAGFSKYIRALGSPLSALIGLNVAAFAVIVAMTLSGSSDAVSRVFCLPSDHMLLVHRPWTLVSFTVAQADLLQLLFNMLWLYAFGRLFLMRERGLNLWLLYFGGAAFAGLLYVCFNRYFFGETATVLVGASAAVIAIGGAVAVLLPDMRLYIPLIGPTKISWIVPVVIIIFALGLSTDNAGGNIAHLGGALAGMTYGLAARYLDRRRSPDSVTAEADYLRILDKVRRSGYASLNADERRTLLKYQGKY